MSCNIGTALDEDVQYSDWIELYNGGSSSVNLNNYYLSDDVDSLKKWKFPSLSISAGGFRRIWCSGKNRTGSTSNLHTNFSLKASGESIYLSNPSGNVIDNISFNTIPPDRTFGRLTNGSSTLCYLSKVTYMASNNGSTIITGIITTKPDFSLPGGMYPVSQNIILSDPNPTYTIRYTLDGSDPTENSPVYTNPINVHSRVGEPNVYSMIRTGYPNHSYLPDWYPPIGEVYKCNVLRARSFKTGHFPGPVKTETYFIDPNIFSRYGNLPLVSIVSDPKNLFNDTTGIYVPGLTYQQTQDHGNYHNEWDRPANIEIYKPDGTKEFNGNFKIAIGGESSESSPQKGLKVNADDDYGPGKIDYPIFEDTKGKAKYIQKFDKIKIRAWGTDRRKGLLHDGFCVSFMEKTDLDYEAYQPCVVFINGEYWGLQELRERNKNGQYYESHYYIDHENPGFDILKGGGNSVEEGDAIHWNAMMNFINSNSMSNTANYEYVKTQMDVDNFMLYFMFSIYFSRGDWPDQNEAKWRAKIPGAKWKWIQWDMDNTVANNLPPWFDMFQQCLVGNANYGPSPLLAKLVQNAEFKRKFINIFADYMNTSLLMPLTQARLTEKVNELMPYMPEYKARWQLNYTWQNRLDSMYWWLEKRPKYVKEDIISNFNVPDTAQLTLNVSDTLKGKIKINTVLLDRNTPRLTTYTYPWKGTYYKTNTVPLTAIPNPGFRFVRWLPSNDTNKTIQYTPTGTASLTAMFDIDPNYQPVVLPVINEAMNSNASAIADNFGEFDDWIEIYNPGNDTINIAGYYLTSNLVLPTRWRIATQNDSTKIPPHGYKLIWMDDDTQQGILHASFKLNAGGDFVALIAPDGETVVDSITIGNYSPDQSWGRATDNNPNWIVFNVSTPNQTNSACAAPGNLVVTTNSTSPCTGTTVNFAATAAGNVTTWSWTGPNGFSSSTQNPSLNITQTTQSGTYTVAATNACGNTSTTIQLNVVTLPSNVSASVNSNSVCTGSSVNLTGNASGNVNGWSWSGPNSYSSTTQNPVLNISQISQGGIYIVSATNTCGSSTASVQLTVSSAPSNVTAATISPDVCIGSNVTLNAGGIGNISSWSWSGPNGFTSSSQNPAITISQASQAGNYVVTATNSCGISSASVQLNIVSSPSNVVANSSNSTACTGSSISLSATANGTVTSWSWSGPGSYSSNSQNPALNINLLNQSGTYIVTATNICGSNSSSVLVQVITSPANVTASSNATTACIGSMVNLSASATGTVSSWSWTGPAVFNSALQNPSVVLSQLNQGGNYIVTATNSCGSNTSSVLLNVATIPSNVVASSNLQTICTGNALNLNGSASGNVSFWNWTGPNGFTSTLQNPVVNISQLSQSGNYAVVASNICGTASASVIVNVNSSPLNVLASSSTNSACSGSTVNLSASATGGVNSWSWTGPNGFTSNIQNPALVISGPAQSGNYAVTVSNSCGTAGASVIVNVVDPPVSVSANASSNTACIGTAISLLASAIGPVISWTWTGPDGFSSTQQNPVLSIDQLTQEGTYQVVATNSCGSSSASVFVSVNSTPVNLTASSSSASGCTGTSISLNGTASGTVTGWNWTGPAGFASSLQNPVLNLTQISQTGIYIVTATTSCGSLTASVHVTAETTPSGINAAASSVNPCTGSHVDLFGSATGSVTTWSWIGPNAFSSSTQNPGINITQQSQAGNYIVVASNDCGSSSASVSISVNSSPVNVAASASSNTVCIANSVSLNATSGGNVIMWSWSGPNGFNSLIQNPTLVINQVSQAGSYVVTATNSCGSNTSSVQLTVNTTPLNVTATTNNASPCTGSSITLNGNSGNNVASWAWSGPNGFSSNTQNPVVSITHPLQSGQYIVTATNSCGSETSSILINVVSSPSGVTASAGTQNVCTGTTLNLAATSVGTVTNWSWSGPSGFNSIQQNPSVNITQTGQGGNYVVTATNGCGSNSSSVSISVVESPFNVIASSTSTTPCTGTDINLSSNALGNITSWTWTGPAGFTSTQQNPLVNIANSNQSGTYTVLATNSCGSSSASVLLNVNGSPVSITAVSSSTNTCVGNTISLNASANGTVSSWSWTGPAGFTSLLEDPLLPVTQLSQAGVYIVTASSGCGNTTASVSITVGSAPTSLVASSGVPSACIGGTITLSSSASGQVSNWEWSGPGGYVSTQQNPVLSITQTSQTGIYTVSATNNCGSTSSSVQIYADSLITHPVAVATPGIVCIGSSVDFQGSATGNVLTWDWTGPGGFTSTVQNPSLNILQTAQSGIYTVTVTNDCGSTNATVLLSVNDKPSALVASSFSDSVCIGTTINLSASAMGAVTDWSWNGPGGYNSNLQNPSINIIQVTQSGIYTVSAANDCGSISAGISLTVITGPSNPVASANNTNICIGSLLELEGSASGDITSWSWSGPNGFSSSLQNPDLLITGSNQGGMYTLVVSDNCSSTSSAVTVTVETIPSGVLATVSGNNVCPGETVDLNGNAFGTVTGWNWTGPNGFSSSLENITLVNVQSFQSGVYTVTASNNCGSNSSAVNLVILPAPTLLPLAAQSNYIIISPINATDHVQWYYNNNAVPGNDNDSLMCQGDGDYYCIVTNVANCSSVSGIMSIANCSSVGMDDELSLSGLTVFPSPTHSKVWLEGKLRNARYSIELLNILGKTLIKREFNIRNNYIEAGFDLENLAAGIYVLSIRSENSGATYRIIKE